MFGTPDNEVIVNVLPKQYINPKYPLTEIWYENRYFDNGNKTESVYQKRRRFQKYSC
jgi:hypothetical protein